MGGGGYEAGGYCKNGKRNRVSQCQLPMVLLRMMREQHSSRPRYSQDTAIPEDSDELLQRQRQRYGLQVETTATEVVEEDTGPDDEGRRNRGDCWTFGRGKKSANHSSFICVRSSSDRWK